MMINRWVRILSLYTVLCTYAIIFSVESLQAAATPWWEKHDEGWFFYNEEIEPEEPKLSPQPNTEIVKETKPDESPAEAFRKEGERLLGVAIMNPTEDNIVKYMRYQKEALDRSNKFAYVWQRLLQKYPDLYLNTSTDQVYEEVKETVNELGKTAGLFFIYHADCSACQKAATTVRDFRTKYPSFGVIPVAVDVPLPELPDSKADNGIVARLGVTVYPSWYLAYPQENRFELLGQGYMTLYDLERRLYQYEIVEKMGVGLSDSRITGASIADPTDRFGGFDQ
ncbi:MAG TPA: conjugal transfer protein TraF [Sedimentisphaerales bacterium]|nr:conjugal transfer protein TraF [Sedimentisphaerales bacterium]